MTKYLIKLLEKLLSPRARKFEQALQTPEIAQQRVKQEISASLIKSEYGQALGIKSVEDWEKIPIVDYDDLKPWISPSNNNLPNKYSLLTPEAIIFYEKTSGSRGPVKLIPYTKSLRRSFSQMFCIWAYDLIIHGPKFSTGKIYFSISPKLTPTDNLSPQDDSEYLDRWLRFFLSPFLVFSPISSKNVEEFKHQLCLTLLRETNLETISIWSPSFLTVHLDYIYNHRYELAEELKNKISSDRLDLLTLPEIPWEKLWPQLKLISCWDSVNAADSAAQLRLLFPSILVQGKGLLATEGPITVPLIAAKGCVPLLDEVFFEFEDDKGIHLLHQLELGNPYNLILSQKGGLYRYRLGDRLSVSHFYHNTPCLTFLGRSNTTSDLVGEKLHEDFVFDVLTSLDLKEAAFKSLVPIMKPLPHYVLLLDRAQESGEAISLKLESGLCQSYHYQQARLLGQLGSAKVVISQEMPEIVAKYRMESGSRWGDIKYPILETSAIKEELWLKIMGVFEARD